MFWGLQYQTNQKTWNRLEDNRYPKEETILLKIPMALPYSLGDGSYKRMRGEFEHQGEFYKGIKQKLQQDTLYIVCIKDQKQKHLVNTMTRYEKMSNDLPSKTKNTRNIWSKLGTEYESLLQLKTIHTAGWSITFPYSQGTSEIISFEQAVQSPPPKIFS